MCIFLHKTLPDYEFKAVETFSEKIDQYITLN